MNIFWYNAFKGKDEFGVDVSISNQYINTHDIAFNHVESSDQNVCIEKIDSTSIDETHIHDATIVKIISYCDKNELCDDALRCDLATAEKFCDDYVHDDIPNIFRHEVVAYASQSWVSVEAKSYVSNDENEVFDLTLHEEVTYEKDIYSHISES